MSPRKENKNTARLEAGMLYCDDSFGIADVPRWQAWLELHTSFYYASAAMNFTARYERRGQSERLYWYGYKRHNGKLFRQWIGKSQDVTPDKLAQVAHQLSDKIEAHEQ